MCMQLGNGICLKLWGASCHSPSSVSQWDVTITRWTISTLMVTALCQEPPSEAREKGKERSPTGSIQAPGASSADTGPPYPVRRVRPQSWCSRGEGAYVSSLQGAKQDPFPHSVCKRPWDPSSHQQTSPDPSQALVQGRQGLVWGFALQDSQQCISVSVAAPLLWQRKPPGTHHQAPPLVLHTQQVMLAWCQWTLYLSTRISV